MTSETAITTVLNLTINNMRDLRKALEGNSEKTYKRALISLEQRQQSLIKLLSDKE